MSTPAPNGGAAPPAASPPADPKPKTVAYENFQAVVTAKEGLAAQVETLKGEIQQLTEKAATVDTLSAQLREWQGKAAAAEGRFTAFTEFSGALGTTDAEVIGLFDERYGKLPEKDRPTRADWAATLKAKPDEAPALLRPWLAPATQPAGGAGAPRPGTPAPRSPGTGAAPAAGATASAQQLREMRDKAMKTGDWSEYKKYRVDAGIAPAPRTT